MKKFLININGELFDEETAKIPVLDRGFLYGDSVYEATRTFNRKPFRIDLHLERLYKSAEKIELIPTISKAQILEELSKTLAASPHENHSIRIILTRGTNRDLGLDPELSSANNLVIMTKAIPENPAWWYFTGISVIFHQKKSSQKGALPKSGNYLENLLAQKEALARGATDALMLNTEGHVTEGTTSNVWLIKNGKVFTPPLSDGILDGLTRKTLFDMAQVQNLFILEASLTQDDFLSADEVFITSTTRNLVPVTKIENYPVGDGKPGKMTLELLARYLAFVNQ